MHPGVANENSGLNGNGIRNGADARVSEILEGLENELNDLVQGLGLLGIKRCAWCRRFFRSSDPGALFGGAGESVCFECIPLWWPSRREQLSCPEQRATEGDLVCWLRSFHQARTVHGSNRLKRDQAVKFELLASCLECHGTGVYLGDKRCRYCAGPGTVRVVVPERSR
jgi:hypothetical protein